VYTYTWDLSKPHVVIFTRYDPINGGYVIGSADYYLKDANNASHHLTANFKLRRG
jgi:hypothetical protein